MTDSNRSDEPPEQNAGWAIFSYLLSGMLFYGAAGWVASRLAHLAILFPVGMLVGLALAIAGIIFKYGRP
jgi:ATP synthase protein I